MQQGAISKAICMSPTTLARRAKVGRFNTLESDRLVTMIAVFEKAISLFERDVAAAAGWMSTPVRRLGSKRPLDIMRARVERRPSSILSAGWRGEARVGFEATCRAAKLIRIAPSTSHSSMIIFIGAFSHTRSIASGSEVVTYFGIKAQSAASKRSGYSITCALVIWWESKMHTLGLQHYLSRLPVSIGCVRGIVERRPTTAGRHLTQPVW